MSKYAENTCFTGEKCTSLISFRLCLSVPIEVKIHHDRSNSSKGKHVIRAVLQFRGLVHYHHGGKHGGMQVDMVLGMLLRVLHLYPQAAERDCLAR